jgi:hypothetical protein
MCVSSSKDSSKDSSKESVYLYDRGCMCVSRVYLYESVYWGGIACTDRYRNTYVHVKYVYIYTRVYIHWHLTHTRTHVWTHIHACIHIYVHVYLRKHMHMYISIYACMFVDIHVHVHYSHTQKGQIHMGPVANLARISFTHTHTHKDTYARISFTHTHTHKDTYPSHKHTHTRTHMGPVANLVVAEVRLCQFGCAASSAFINCILNDLDI